MHRLGFLLTSDVKTRPAASDEVRSRDEGAKRSQILDGARTVFLADGFDAASMNEIARTAGVSKGTLYVYFDSKEALFEALIRQEKQEQAEQMCRFDHANHDVETVLREFGARFLDRMFRPSSLAHFRTVVAVAQKFPRIGRAFYEAGPEFGRKRLADYLASQKQAGIIAMDDPSLAAVFFLDLCKSCHMLPMLLGVAPVPSADEIADHMRAAVAMFLRAYPLKA
jgi:AcrR family transcriptional regulator